MTSPINPVLVIRNNLPEWKADLEFKRDSRLAEIECINVELATIERLEAALEPVDNSN